jgi:hypothetical protein
MLNIHMPDSYHKDRARRRRRALGYLIAGLVIMPTIFIAGNTTVWYAPVILEAWWLWACWTDKDLRK